MVLMEESDKPTLVIDRDLDGLNDIVESSCILEASHVREVRHTHTHIYSSLLKINTHAPGFL